MLFKAVVDRFEDDKVVLLVGDEEVAAVWPRKFLPMEAREGDILSLNISTDPEATRAAKAEAEELMRKLLKRNE
jgi:hypothetical protein